MVKTAQATAFLWLSAIDQSLAQTTTTPTAPTPAQPGPTAPPPMTFSTMNWLWLLIAAAVVAAVIWYLMRRRASPRP